MSASALVTLAVLAIVGVILYRQYRQERDYFSGSRGDAQRVEAPPLSDAELAAQRQAVTEALAAHPLPSARIVPRAEKPALPWQSKFGGRPYWPRGMQYPATPDGKPLYMLAQLNLAEVPALPGYPRQGMLQFFIADDDLMGLKFGKSLADTICLNSDGSGSRVVYHATVVEHESQLDSDVPDCRDGENLPLNAEYALSFALIEEKPAPTDHRFDHATAGLAPLADTLMDELREEESGAGSKLGGYANFTQDDPRHSLPPGEWLLLLQLDTANEKGVDIMWGDCGVGNWFIRRDDLAEGDFSHVWFNWDCC